MNLKKSRSVLTNSQQNGIFLLVGLIIIVLISIAYYDYKYPKFQKQYSIVDTTLQKKLDSLKLVKAKSKKAYTSKIYPFNPNFLKEGKAYRLGLSADEHNRLLDFREKGKWINSAEDFKRVTQVSDKLLNKIKPYFKFPEWVVAQQKERRSKPKLIKSLSFDDKKDLNTATLEDLKQINGIGEALSVRIVRYRDKIGGFRSDLQLKDVYGLKLDVIERLTSQITVKSNLNQPLIDINNATLIELVEIPYFNYELAREIFQFVKVNEGIDSFEELSKLQQFPAHKIDRIKLYLKINK
jgi:competence ComEA-like helix-hairpin-helix protein